MEKFKNTTEQRLRLYQETLKELKKQKEEYRLYHGDGLCSHIYDAHANLFGDEPNDMSIDVGFPDCCLHETLKEVKFYIKKVYWGKTNEEGYYFRVKIVDHWIARARYRLKKEQSNGRKQRNKTKNAN